MENIQTDEEMQPLTMTSTRRVVEAYSHKESPNILKKCAYYILILTFLGCIVYVHESEGDRKQKRAAKKLRNRAEIMPEKAVQKLRGVIEGAKLDEKVGPINPPRAAALDTSHDDDGGSRDEDTSLIHDIMKDEDDLEVEVQNVLADVDMVELREVDTYNSMLATAVRTMEDSISSYLGRAFGYGNDERRGHDDDDDDDDAAAVSDASSDIELTEQQLDAIAKRISEKLELDAKAEFRSRADSVKAMKKDEIKSVLEEDRRTNMNARDIAEDVREAQSVVVEDLKDEIDDVATAVKDSLPEKAKRIRDSVVEEVTGKKLDDIENTRRAKAAKRKELRKKFEEMQAKKRNAPDDIDSLKLRGGKNPKAVSDDSAEDKSNKADKDSDGGADDKSKDSDNSANDKSKASDNSADEKSKDVEKAEKEPYQARAELKMNKASKSAPDDSNEGKEKRDETSESEDEAKSAPDDSKEDEEENDGSAASHEAEE